MAKLVPAGKKLETQTFGRIEEQLGLRKGRVAKSPAPTTRTLEQQYQAKGVKDVATIKDRIASDQAQLDYWNERVKAADAAGKDSSRQQASADKYSDRVHILKQQITKASSGKYNINELITYSLQKAQARTERTSFRKPEPTEAIPTKQEQDIEETDIPLGTPLQDLRKTKTDIPLGTPLQDVGLIKQPTIPLGTPLQHLKYDFPEPIKLIKGETTEASIIKPEYFKESAVVSAYKEPTEEQKEFGAYVKRFYPDKKPSELTRDIRENIIAPYGNLWSDISGQRETPEQEIFTIKKLAGDGFGTSSYGLTPSGDLSKGAGYLRSSVKEELVAQANFEADIRAKKQEITNKYSSGGITKEEADKANKELQTYYTTRQKELQRDIKRREMFRKQKFFPSGWLEKKLPAFKIDAGKTEFEAYQASSKVWGTTGAFGARPFETKAGVAGLSFIGGAYEGLRLHPVKTAVTAGAFVALPGIFKVTSGASKALGITKAVSAYSTTITKLTTGASRGLYGLYGTSVAGRLAFTPTTYGKFAKGGEIFATEIAPMALGGRLGAYGVRRYEVAAELRRVTRLMPKAEQITFKSLLKEAKAYRGIQPEISEITFKRLKLLEGNVAAEKALLKYFGGRKDIIVGGSIAQQAQMTKGIKLKRPGDIDIYFKGGEWKGIEIARDMASVLKGVGVKGIRVKGAKVTLGGEKLIEAHPFSTYFAPNIEQVLPWYKTARAGYTKSPSGINIMKLDVQWQRKLVGFYTEPYISGKVRVKDLPAAQAIREQFLKTTGAPSLKPSGAFDIKTSVIDTGVRVTPKVKTKDIFSTISSYSAYSAYKPTSYAPYTPFAKPSVLPPYPTFGKPTIAPYTPVKTKKVSPIAPYTPTATKIPSMFQTKADTPYFPKLSKSIVPAFSTQPIYKPKKVKEKSIFRLLFPDSSISPTTGKQQGYMPQAKSRGKWKNLSKKPMTRGSAFGRASRVVDHTTSASGRVKPRAGKVSRARDDYFSRNRAKFRPGRAANSFVERKGISRIDTRGEKMGLTVAKMVKNRGWLMSTQKKKVKRKVIKKSKKKTRRKSQWLV